MQNDRCNSILIKNNNKMEKLVRYRKAFYEKENDLHHCNKRNERIIPNHAKSINIQKTYQTQTNLTQSKLKNNTFAYCQAYGQQLLNLPQYNQRPHQFLSNHSIDAVLRARMLDWMVEVTSSYKFTNKTYFDSANLMDRYFKAEGQSLSPSKLHLIGVQAMLIATKMEEVYPLKIRTVYQKIAHKKLSFDDLIETQAKIMRTLQYKLNTWSFFDLVMLKISMFVNTSKNSKFSRIQINQQMREKQLESLQQICSYLSKFVLYDYQFYIQHTTLLIAQSIVKACFQIEDIIAPENFFSCSMILVELCKQKIVGLIKSYGDKFEGLNNIYKFTDKRIIKKVQQFLQ